MNNPEYFLVDEMAVIAERTRKRAGLAALNYQYGFVKELDSKIQEAQKANADKASTIYPLLWLMQPFTIRRGVQGYYGVATVKMLIITNTETTWTAEERMERNYKPILYPIRRALYTELCFSSALAYTDEQNRVVTEQDIYYWGENQQTVLTNPVDIVELSNFELYLNNNENCIPTGSIIRG